MYESQGLDDEDFQSVYGKPLSVGNCVACGAFFALCFLHLVPQSEEKCKKQRAKMAPQATSPLKEVFQRRIESIHRPDLGIPYMSVILILIKCVSVPFKSKIQVS